jgi:hypothetical protein
MYQNLAASVKYVGSIQGLVGIASRHRLASVINSTLGNVYPIIILVIKKLFIELHYFR